MPVASNAMDLVLALVEQAAPALWGMAKGCGDRLEGELSNLAGGLWRGAWTRLSSSGHQDR